ncbi:hypothetical protein EYF80_023080 [Liparis tanakae]|uniref:Uncharacterized protein n=1 Tax=Liparis tanakae TaxID=230148 RepID=A0A4Z2HMC4_9TELE|nr:hypothetical protein EYF80_023080 [Liparis tanakae]
MSKKRKSPDDQNFVESPSAGCSDQGSVAEQTFTDSLQKATPGPVHDRASWAPPPGPSPPPPQLMCVGLDQCQGTVHELSVETDDILLTASIDPSSACRGSLIKERGAGEDAQICGSHYQVPIGPSAERLQSSASVQMFSGEHDPWSLMWLRAWGGRGSATSNHQFE